MLLVLLDTSIATGYLSRITVGGSEEKTKRWGKVLKELVSAVLDDEPRIAIPTPVFFECACKDKNFFSAIQKILSSNSGHPIFKFVNYSIKSNILLDASLYLLVLEKTSKGSNWFDALIAAYCFQYEYCLITKNQKDFPNELFECMNVALAPIPNVKSERTSVYLLKPRLEVWEKIKSEYQIS